MSSKRACLMARRLAPGRIIGNLGADEIQPTSSLRLRDDVTACLAHRSESVSRAAVGALRHFGESWVEAALLEHLRRPLERSHTRTMHHHVLEALLERYSAPSATATALAVEHLLTLPRSTSADCRRRCTARCNPHTSLSLCRSTCTHRCERERELHVLLARTIRRGLQQVPKMGAIEPDDPGQPRKNPMKTS